MNDLQLKLESIERHLAQKEHDFELMNKMEKAQRISRTLYTADLMNQIHNIKAQIRQSEIDSKRMEG